MTTFLPACPHCDSSVRQTKHGNTPSGSQRYHCHACQRLYTPVPQEQGYPQETRHLAIKLYLEGNGFRRIARLLGCHHQTVANWGNAYQATLQQQTPRLPVPEQVETVELDELYTFVGAKKRMDLCRDRRRSGHPVYRQLCCAGDTHLRYDATSGGCGQRSQAVLQRWLGNLSDTLVCHWRPPSRLGQEPDLQRRRRQCRLAPLPGSPASEAPLFPSQPHCVRASDLVVRLRLQHPTTQEAGQPTVLLFAD